MITRLLALHWALIWAEGTKKRYSQKSTNTRGRQLTVNLNLRKDAPRKPASAEPLLKPVRRWILNHKIYLI